MTTKVQKKLRQLTLLTLTKQIIVLFSKLSFTFPPEAHVDLALRLEHPASLFNLVPDGLEEKHFHSAHGRMSCDGTTSYSLFATHVGTAEVAGWRRRSAQEIHA